MEARLLRRQAVLAVGRKEVRTLARRMFDCRDLPGDCTLVISGEEDEVVDAQAKHAVATHGAEDGEGLRTWIRSRLKDLPESSAGDALAREFSA